MHWYPQNPSNITPPGPTDAGLLADTAQIPASVSALRTEFADWAGNRNLPIMITETNSVSSNPGKQTLSVVNALYLEQDYLTWLENGVANVDWWQIHNGIVTSGDNEAGLAGTADYGDYGVLSDGSCGTVSGAQVCEPPAETPFPAYYGLQLLSRFIQPGDRLLTASSSQGLVQAFAARAAGGAVRAMVVNDDPATSYDLGLTVPGYHLSGAPVLRYGAQSSAVQTLAGAAGPGGRGHRAALLDHHAHPGPGLTRPVWRRPAMRLTRPVIALAGTLALVAGGLAGASAAVSSAAASTAARQAPMSLAAAKAELASTVGAGYWHTSGNQILDAAGNPVRVAGINWYGFETPDEIAHGLWAQDYHTIINDIAKLGYNTIRIPFSNQMVEDPIVPQNLSFYNTGPINTDLAGLTSAAGPAEDRHLCGPGRAQGHPGRPPVRGR